MTAHFVFATMCVACVLVSTRMAPSPVDMDATTSAESSEASANATNATKNVYMVRAYVYEVGILTDDSNDGDPGDSPSFESQERVDLTFFDAHTNETHIDLGSVPLPVQANISGQIFTGIAPVQIGAAASPAELLNHLPITGAIANITRSDTALYRLTATNTSAEDSTRTITTDELTKLLPTGYHYVDANQAGP